MPAGNWLQANAQQDQHLTLVGQVEFQAAAGDGEKAKPRTFSMVAYRGGLLRVAGYYRPVVVDMQGLSAAQGMKAYVDHDTTRRVGHIERHQVSGAVLTVHGVISSTSEAAREVTADADNGYPWQASIGGNVLSLEDVPTGATITVNGQQFTGPIFVARSFRLREVSFVGNGADDQTSASIAAGAAQEITIMNFSEWLKKHGWVEESLTPEQRADLQIAYDAEQAAAANQGGETTTASAATGQPAGGQTPLQASANQQPSQQDRDAAVVAAERQRVADIEAACSALPMSDAVNTLRASAMSGQVTLPDLRARLLDIVRQGRPKAPAVGSSVGPATPQVLSAVMAMQAGGMNDQQLQAAYGEQILTQAQRHRRLSLNSIIRSCVESEGHHLSAMASEQELVAAGFSTVSLPGVLSDSANKTLLSAYNAVPSVAVRVAKKLTANDFKTHTGYRISGDWKLQALGPDGELKHASFSEKGYPFRVATKGRFWGLTREMIRNDDMGAFLDFFNGFGRGYALTREEDFWMMVLANADDFFSSGNKNYISGANTLLSIGGLDLLSTTLRKQTDANGNALMLSGWGLVVPPELEPTADSIYKSLVVNTGGGSSASKVENANRYAGKFEPMCVPHLSTAAYTGNSALAYYLFANPADVPAFGIAYLDGVETPVMEEVTPLPQFLGQCWRVYGDYGVCPLDPRGVAKSKGGA